MKNRYLLISILFLLLAGPVAQAKLKTWSVYSSANFSIYTDARQKDAVHLLKEFENFREIVMAVTSIPRRSENNRLMILMFTRNGDFNKIRPQKNVAGFYFATDAGPRMVVGPSSWIENSSVLFHEYVHYLLREHTDFNYPHWYDEGFADLLGATTFSRNKVKVGAIPPERAYTLLNKGQLKLAELINPDPKYYSDAYTECFYATAWLFVHYLQISPFGIDSGLNNKTSEFIRRFNEGQDPGEAFMASYGITIEEMEKDLRRYQEQGKISVINFEINPYNGPINKKKLSHNERAFILADISWRVGEEESALEYLEELDMNKPDAGRGLSLKAVLENHKGNIDAAMSARKQALDLDGNDTQILSNTAHHDWDSYTRSLEQGTSYRGFLENTLDYSKRAIEKDPTNIEAYEFLWNALIDSDEPIEAVKYMMAAYQLEPGSISINTVIGSYLLALNRPKLARSFILRVYNWSHSPEQKTRAKGLLEQLDAALASTTVENR